MTEPLDVLPLPYESPAGGGDAAQGLVDVIRGVAWVVAVVAGTNIATYTWTLACYAWQLSTVFPARLRAIDGWPLVWTLPQAVASVAAVAAAVECRRLRGAGRRWVVVAAAAEAVTGCVAQAAAGFYYHYARQHPRYGVAFATYMAGSYAMAAAYMVVVWAAVWLFFRHPAVRRRFEPG